MDHKITIIGIGDDGFDGLTGQARELIQTAGTLLGPSNVLERLELDKRSDIPAKVHSLPADLEATAERLESVDQLPIVVLAGGDPLFYGTTRFLCDKLGKDRFEVLPHVSSMQLAFARVKESWDEAYLTNLANQSISHVCERVRLVEKAGIFTTPSATPADMAKALLSQGTDYFTAYVCENLGSPDERVTRATLAEITSLQFSPLNVMILVRLPDVPDRPAGLQGKRLFGNSDDCFLQSQPKRGLLTSNEIRVIALAEMNLGPSSTVWDVGAGSGSVAIEAAQLASSGQTYAIEMDVEDYNLLVENSKTFGTTNLTPVLGEAPAAWADLPDPHAIFVGGTGRAVVGMLDNAWDRLLAGGRLVIHLAGLDNLTSCESKIRELGGEPDVLMLNLARGHVQMGSLRLEAVNPSFLLVTSKPT